MVGESDSDLFNLTFSFANKLCLGHFPFSSEEAEASWYKLQTIM